MRLASIDIGTNSTRLLIAELALGGELKTLLRRTQITRLGEDVDRTCWLKREAIERTLETLEAYGKTIKEFGVGRVKVAATSAVRDARNADDFLELVGDRVGFEVEVLTGKREAELAFLGVAHDWRPSTHDHRPILVIDIGGGSTELILGRSGFGEQVFSLDIGCVRLTEMFIKSDPPLASEIEALGSHVLETVRPAADRIERTEGPIAFGVAGTITTISAIEQEMKVYDPERIHGSKLLISTVEGILGRLVRMPLTERKRVAGLEPARADIIVAGIVILREIMKALGLTELTVSEHDILDGLIVSMLR